MDMSFVLDMLTLVACGLLITRANYQVKFTYLVGLLFIVAVSVKYLTDFVGIGLVIQGLAFFIWCVQHYFYFKSRSRNAVK